MINKCASENLSYVSPVFQFSILYGSFRNLQRKNVGDSHSNSWTANGRRGWPGSAAEGAGTGSEERLIWHQYKLWLFLTSRVNTLLEF